jgi:putative tryptophan/tyrosine transport system substrate-binding protein
MRRREFIAGLGSAAAWSIPSRAQQRGLPVVGCLFSGAPDPNGDRLEALLQGLGEAGFVEGRNVTFVYRWTYNDPKRVAESAAELVKQRVSIIFASTAEMARRAKAATTTIPIVFVAFADAVQYGLVDNLSRPGGNITGVNAMQAELGAKRLELLHMLRPQAERLGLLVNPSLPAIEEDIAIGRRAVKGMGVSLEVLNAKTSNEIDAAFAHAVELRLDALAIARGQFFSDRRVQLTTLAVRYVLPTVFFERIFPEIGGLMSYAARTTDQFHQAGVYLGRILKGDKPADLPVIQPTKFELVINMQTARLLGVEVPPALLAVADEVIE